MRNRVPSGLRSRNPFHPLVLGVGAAFALTACSCVVLYLKKLTATTAGRPSIASDPWLVLLDTHGGMMLSISLAALAIAVLADIVWEYLFAEARSQHGAADGGPTELDKGGSAR